MEDDQQFCLRWNNHQSTLISVFDTLLENGTLVDCTLAAEGKFLKAHKVVLSACSPYFATLLTQQYDKHPVFILKDVKFQELRAMMDYMYRGEVNISQDQLAALLRAAESLQIKGLSDNRGGGGGGSSSSGGDSGSKSENAQKPIPVPVVSKPGLTIEQKRPNKHPAIDADLCESREGSTSPTSRKRKKIRRRSTETNNLVDNHDQLSNSSSQSMPHHHQQQQQQQQTKHMTSSVAPLPQITSATSAANVLNVTKKTDIHEPKKELDQSMQQEVADDDDDDDDQNEVQEQPVRRMKTQHHDIDMSHLKEKMESTHSELLIEPKSEYDDGNDETVEDLTLDEEELLEDLDQAGPSHGGEGSSQGYAQWQVDRSQDEVFLAAQEAAGQHRDAQVTVPEDLGITRIAGLTWAQWNARLAMPLVAQLQDNAQPLVFSSTAAAAAVAAVAANAAAAAVNNSTESEAPTTPTQPSTSSQSLAATPNPQTPRSPVSESNYESKNSSQSNGLGYPCPECGRYYKLKSSLRNHQKWECGKEPQFQCPFCSYKAKQKMHIGRHLERMHKDIAKIERKSPMSKDDILSSATTVAYMTSTASTISATVSATTNTNVSSMAISFPATISVSPIPAALNLTNINTTI